MQLFFSILFLYLLLLGRTESKPSRVRLHSFAFFVFNRKERSQGHSRPCQSIYTPTQAAGRGPRILICKSSLSGPEIVPRYVTWGKPKICDLGRGITQGSQCVDLPPFTFHSLPCVPFDHSGELGTPSTLGPCGPGRQQPSLRLPPGHGEPGS